MGSLLYLLLALTTLPTTLLTQIITNPKPRSLGAITVELAGFTNWFVHSDATDPTEKYTLLLSTFSPVPFTKDTTYAYRHIGKYLDDISQVERLVMTDKVTWPREPNQAPDDVFNFPCVVQPDGFLVPFKDDGSIRVIDVSDFKTPKVYDIAKDENDETLWFYHRVIWKDMDGDGLKDAVTNRANRDAISGKTITEFLWFKHPSQNALTTKWKPNIINKDIGDTFLMEADLKAGDKTINCILTIGYFNKNLAIHWSEHPQGLWTDPDQIRTRIVDKFGKYFDLNLYDMNNDGKKDLVTTVNSDKNGTLHVYFMPDDFRTGEFPMRILSSGYFPRSGLPQGAGAPGTFSAFWPSNAMKDQGLKPWLLMSGDDDGRQYLFTPNSQDKDSWSYTRTTLLDEGEFNIVGKPTVADVNGDGYADVFLPSWAAGKIYAYTYKP